MKLQQFGPVVVIGGMIRDLALAGNQHFGSDVDFVVKPLDIEQFESFMAQQSATRNKFGGYVWHSSHWRIDVWPLQKTWAFEAGHVKVDSFSDLLRCTFFDADAIIYDLRVRKLVCDAGYFERLKRRELEINLLANPNPVGNAVRALRYAAIKKFGWGPQLCKFVAKQIDENGWDELKRKEIQSFRTWYIKEMDHTRVQSELLQHLKNGQESIFRSEEWCRRKQSEFGFGDSAEDIGAGVTGGKRVAGRTGVR